MKYYLIVGEASGDLHASNLMLEIKRLDRDANFRFWGGDLMKAAGGELVKHYKELAFMGFLEVLFNIRTILKNIRFCKEDLLKYQPDVVILVDYPGFNLRIAKFLHENGIKVFYYISPQLWAWNAKRVHKIKRLIDRMFVILPFEQEFYRSYDYPVDFVGHPLLDVITSEMKFRPRSLFLEDNILDEKPIVALLPGSRKQEIARMLHAMLAVCPDFPQYQFVIAGAPSIAPSYYESLLVDKNFKVVYNQTYELLHNSDAALVTSGTATLETALMMVPQVVCYKGSPISFLIARQLVKVKFISLVNLIMDKMIVKELIQNELNPRNISSELKLILEDTQYNEKMRREYLELKRKLGGKGASANAADKMIQYLNEMTV